MHVSPREAGSSRRKQLAHRNMHVCYPTLKQCNSSMYLPNPPTNLKNLKRNLPFKNRTT